MPLHATAIAYGGAGCVLMGPSGSGKSRLAAEMLALGARLVGDDQLVLSVQSGMLMAAAHPNLSGIMELRGLGLIRLSDIIPRHVVHLAVELSTAANERLPAPQTTMFCGQPVPLVRVAPPPQTNGASILQYLKAMQEGRILPPDWHPQAAN